ncbi:MAG: deaminase [Thermoguttaceae bacterium]
MAGWPHACSALGLTTGGAPWHFILAASPGWPGRKGLNTMAEGLTEAVCWAVVTAESLVRESDWPDPWGGLAIDTLRAFVQALDRGIAASNGLVERAAEFRGHYATAPDPIAGHSAASYHELGRHLASVVFWGVFEAADRRGFVDKPDFDRILRNLPAVRLYLQSEAPRFDSEWLVARIRDEGAKAEQRTAATGADAKDPDLQRKFMVMAVEEARKSKSEGDGVHPMVGAVVVKDGNVLATGHRGERAEGDHAEYTALEKKLRLDIVAGATVYTTLEPCTSRGPGKIPCVERLIERKVKRVVIGIPDPNRTVYGEGWAKLQEARIDTANFDTDLKDQIEEMNREFIRLHTPARDGPPTAPET